MKSLVSVIIPSYNSSSVILETINSALNQTYKNFEIIVVDDGSLDDTEKIVKNIKDDRIQYHRQNHKGCPAAARNTGIRRAKGEYIAFLDSDDIWLPDKMSKQLSILKDRKDILAVASNLFRFPKEQVKGLFAFRNGKLLLFSDKVISFKYMLKKSIVCNSSVILRRELFDEIGYLDERMELKAVEDYDYLLRILDYKDHSVFVLKDVLVGYRLHNNAISLLDTVKDQNYKLSIVYDKFQDKYPLLIDKAKKKLVL